MNLSILLDNNIIHDKITMEEKTQIRNNREIFKLSTKLEFFQNGEILVYENNKQKENIVYSINNIDKNINDAKWYQLNSPCDTYVIQVKLQNIEDQLILLKIAVQKLLGKKNILLNI